MGKPRSTCSTVLSSNVLKLREKLCLASAGLAEVCSSLHFQLLLWPSGVRSRCKAPKPITNWVCQTELLKIFGFDKSLLVSCYTHFFFCSFSRLETLTVSVWAVVIVIGVLIQGFVERRELGQSCIYLQCVCLHVHPKARYRGHK